jgi:hypothetical protein
MGISEVFTIFRLRVERLEPIVKLNKELRGKVKNYPHFRHNTSLGLSHDELGFHKLCARWVPRELTAEHKRKRVEICQRLIDRIKPEETLMR